MQTKALLKQALVYMVRVFSNETVKMEESSINTLYTVRSLHSAISIYIIMQYNLEYNTIKNEERCKAMNCSLTVHKPCFH